MKTTVKNHTKMFKELNGLFVVAKREACKKMQIKTRYDALFEAYHRATIEYHDYLVFVTPERNWETLTEEEQKEWFLTALFNMVKNEIENKK